MNKKHLQLIANSLHIPEWKIENTYNLLADGATIPFISRYRKEATGSLDEVQIADISKEINRLQELEKRRESILKSIEEQGKLTEELKKRIEAVYTMTELEDLYLPYKKKKRTRGMVAKEKGLEPLAAFIFEQRIQNVDTVAAKYLTDEVTDIDEAIQGAQDIIAEWVNEDEKARNKIRFLFEREAIITSKVARGKQEEGEKYEDYFEFSEPLRRIPSHRLLAIRRGENEGFLRVNIAPDEENAHYHLDRLFLKGNGQATNIVAEAVRDSYKRLLAPAIETEFRKSSKEIADAEAIDVFSKNLRQLLLSAPLGQKRVMGIDPGFRTGCKVVTLNDRGDLRYNTTIYPHPPQSRAYEAIATIEELVEKYEIEAIAIGNGTAGKETFALLKNADFNFPVDIFMVNEAGASVYSASPIAREEFPDHDVTVRGAVSIGRRLMDPLAELVKIDPKSIGVGQYQHDVNQVKLKEGLDLVVESCVNAVGVNVNTASQHLLTYVSGLGSSLAKKIVAYRSENGNFSRRMDLKRVPRMGEKAFEQAAGFLRIRNGKNPLDNTAVHPESYHIVEKMADDLNCTVTDLINDAGLRKRINLKEYVTEKAGLPTLRDILQELEKPGLDPRGKAKTFEFADNIKTIEDLHEGMVLPGIITNITNFGAFVDIGIKTGGLVHISNLANKFVKSPSDVVSLNDKVMVKVIGIDIPRGRIQLSMKDV